MSLQELLLQRLKDAETRIDHSVLRQSTATTGSTIADARAILLQTAEKMRVLGGDEQAFKDIVALMQSLNTASASPLDEATSVESPSDRKRMLGELNREHSLHFNIVTSDAPVTHHRLQNSSVADSFAAEPNAVDEKVLQIYRVVALDLFIYNYIFSQVELMKRLQEAEARVEQLSTAQHLSVEASSSRSEFHNLIIAEITSTASTNTSLPETFGASQESLVEQLKEAENRITELTNSQTSKAHVLSAAERSQSLHFSMFTSDAPVISDIKMATELNVAVVAATSLAEDAHKVSLRMFQRATQISSYLVSEGRLG
jgi:vacuolar-type H+-ATPase subunit I/STV1